MLKIDAAIVSMAVQFSGYDAWPNGDTPSGACMGMHGAKRVWRSNVAEGHDELISLPAGCRP